MKIVQNFAFKALQVWSIALLGVLVVSIAFAIFQVATGNIQSTASFEF